jgi:hypothetical protein
VFLAEFSVREGGSVMKRTTANILRVVAAIVFLAALAVARFNYVALDVAENSKNLNDIAAQSAPQQQVVNGWYIGDELHVLIAQNTALIVLGGLILLVLTLGLTASPAGSASSEETRLVPGTDPGRHAGGLKPESSGDGG